MRLRVNPACGGTVALLVSVLVDPVRLRLYATYVKIEEIPLIAEPNRKTIDETSSATE